MRALWIAGLMLLSLIAAAPSAAAQTLGPELQAYAYPYPVSFFPLRISGQDFRMAYMDVAPTAEPNGRTIVLLHGKNFCGAYWKDTIACLAGQGYRVVAPDQLGFGKSSKPETYYTFQLLAASTKRLLDSLGIEHAAVLGHSMGGMLATRFALMYPDFTSQLILEDPIGLEDYKTVVPYWSVDELTAGERRSLEDIRKYHMAYYAEWKPEYDEWVRLQYALLNEPDGHRLTRISALTTQMIYTQPVVYEFPLLRVPTLLVVGLQDRTAIGKDKVAPQVAETMGNYPVLGKRTAAAIPGAKLVELDNCGHLPHLEQPEQFRQALLEFLATAT
jgi:pimeloyl-ACP methyl ester carboxylesterase